MGNVSNAVIQFLSSGKTRMAILGLLVLTTGLFTTIYLVGQQQDVRQRAASGVTCNSCATQGSAYFCKNIYFLNSEFCSPTDASSTTANVTCIAVSSCASTPIPSPQPTSTGGGTTSTACNNCLAQGKQYYCPGYFGFGATCSNNSSSAYGACTKCQAATTPVPTLIPSPTATPSPTNRPSPTITTNPACAGSTGKANGCVCDINAHCASGFCQLNSLSSGVCASVQTTTAPTSTPNQLTCDPNKDGVINVLDFQWWKDEGITLTRTTKEADCFNPDGIVNLADFQVWKDIAITKVKQPF